ncbi:hypothetical protein KHQ88_07005 [Mycoplasmatota bacterium]|nr:hypothetical protein KHQ88_07005 [Mycoplasmatota bacterium]
MDKHLINQIKLSKDEKVFYDFNKLRGKRSDCRMVLTTKRLIVYNDGIYYQKKRKVRRKGINEIQRNTITHVEYYIEYMNSTYIAKLIGFILLVAGLVLAAFSYSGSTLLPSLSVYAFEISGMFILINDLIYYGLAFILVIIGLMIIFKAKKTLFFKVISGHMDDYTVQLKKNKYNEEAIKRISTKLYV